ncbi:hypothetical protein H5410_054302 [Solanum commersonii]|uniref:Uncharacterized protein n=1 Tax=Solanum commersonii TaxID=4109 RepID=A0A9J5X676_SOLCO|nr:hypothetical protein H5410_054302 [Solanum commersonii]
MINHQWNIRIDGFWRRRRFNIRVFFAQMDVVAIIYTSSMLIPEIYCKNIYAVDLTRTNCLRCIKGNSIPFSSSVG